MSIETVSPFSAFTTMQPKVALSNNSVSKNNQKPITTPISKQTEGGKLSFLKSSKFVKGAAITAGIAFITLNIISSLKKHEADFLQRQSIALKSEAWDVLDTSDEIQDIARRTCRKISDFITEGAQNGFSDVLDDEGNIIRKFTLSGNGLVEFIEEFTESGALARKTKLCPSDISASGVIPKTIEEFIAGTEKSNRYIFNQNGMLQSATFGILHKDDKLISVEKGFIYNDMGICTQYFTKLRNSTKNRASCCKKRIVFGEDLIDKVEINKKNGVVQKLFKYEKDKIDKITVNKKGIETVYTPNNEGVLVAT